VIITINDKNAGLYNALFAKAYQALEAINKLKPEVVNEEKRFLSLDDYFAHMADLLALDPAYMMLPIDEAAFTINANTRAISTPKVVTLQNDQIAETLTFTIDRYFDYMDLYNATVYVQWTLPSGKEGATEIELKDITTMPGKIRFGWPLDSDVTSEIGTVRYSVRFWQKGMIKENGSDVEKVVYSFNTLTSSLIISPSLQPEVNPELEINKPVTTNLFKRAIMNSQITSGSTPVPLAPSFGDPGLNLPVYASLANDTLTLKAQAFVSDTGILAYEWYYTPAVTETIEGETFAAGVEYPFSDYVDETGADRLGFHVYGGTVEHNHFEEIPASEYKDGLVLGEVYYVKSGENSDAYIAYTSALPPTDESVKLYQRFTAYTVPAGEVKVTGDYCVRATNTIGSNTSAAHPSQVCRLVSPDGVEFTANLANAVIIPDDESKRLSVKTNKQTSNSALVTYTWVKDVAGSDFAAAESVASSADNYVDITTPGWYKVTASALLNRETKSAVSGVCKATFAPKLPLVTYTDEAETKIPQGDTRPYYTGEGDFTLEVLVGTLVPDGYDAYAEELFSENLSFVWKVAVADQEERTLGQADIDSGLIKSELGKNTLTVNGNGETKRTFICYVTNTLNGQTVTSDSTNSLAFLVL
jgi:hypothetical protein